MGHMSFDLNLLFLTVHGLVTTCCMTARDCLANWVTVETPTTGVTKRRADT